MKCFASSCPDILAEAVNDSFHELVAAKQFNRAVIVIIHGEGTPDIRRKIIVFWNWVDLCVSNFRLIDTVYTELDHLAVAF